MVFAHARLPDWEARLTDHVRGVDRDAPFDMGRLSCALWVADGVKAMTGHDPAPDWRDLHDTEAEILRDLRDRHGDLLSATSAALGPVIAAEQARRGDVVLHIVGRNRQALGICIGREFMALADRGVGTRPMHTAVCAWRVG